MYAICACFLSHFFPNFVLSHSVKFSSRFSDCDWSMLDSHNPCVNWCLNGNPNRIKKLKSNFLSCFYLLILWVLLYNSLLMTYIKDFLSIMFYVYLSGDWIEFLEELTLVWSINAVSLKRHSENPVWTWHLEAWIAFRFFLHIFWETFWTFNLIFRLAKSLKPVCLFFLFFAKSVWHFYF
jgi:hypothetical protein